MSIIKRVHKYKRKGDNKMAVVFKQAKRAKVWLKILLQGASGSGKSYGALRIADGIAKECDSRVAYIGTEGSRNQYYANEFDYDLLDLEEPFTSEKYIEALDAAVEAGYKVIIIDSLSHEWKWLNEVHDKMPGNSFTNWGKLKPRHAAMMDKILNSPIHVIATARGKDEYVLEDKNGKQVPKKVGMGAQQDKDISYEYTVSLMISQDTHVASADKDNTHLFDGKYEVLTEKHGKALYDWANSGEAPAVVKETKKVEASSDDEIAELRKQITETINAKGGQKNKDILAYFKANGNYNSFTDVDALKKYIADIEAIDAI